MVIGILGYVLFDLINVRISSKIITIWTIKDKDININILEE